MLKIKNLFNSFKNRNVPFYPFAFDFLANYKSERGIVKRLESELRVSEKWGKIRYFKDVTTENILAYDQYLTTEKGYKQSYINSLHHTLRLCIKEALVAGRVKTNPYTEVRIWKDSFNDITYRHINSSEISTLIETKQESPILEFASDLFIFQACTGLSYADVMTIRYDNLKEIEGQWWLVGRRNKTGVRFIVPVLSLTMNLIDKYKSIFKISKRLIRKDKQNVFPYISGLPNFICRKS